MYMQFVLSALLTGVSKSRRKDCAKTLFSRANQRIKGLGYAGGLNSTVGAVGQQDSPGRVQWDFEFGSRPRPGNPGREAVQRRHSLQAMRSRGSDKRPTAAGWDQLAVFALSCMAQTTLNYSGCAFPLVKEMAAHQIRSHLGSPR
ncbi:hypothetical protein QBC35DRAFT_16564 [Podospora australis]|uniref:Uncharacterized protein n=1 Tax=Podospora australis TaxID=1536484 RepID=A0AAN6WSC0_9PEZI|nr:hypothetical protein QBC35DRAFT_16564 [Podospora australis]